jgi:hypothetical protein
VEGVAGGVPVAGGVLEGDGVPVAGGAGVSDGQFGPKSGHATPEKYTPKMVPMMTKTQQTTAAMIPVLIIYIFEMFF